MRSVGDRSHQPDTVVNAEDLIGKVCQIDVIHDSYEDSDGKKRTNAKVDQRGFAPVDDTAKAAAPSTTAPTKAGASRLFG